MVFSSQLFLYCFLPLFLFLYYIANSQNKNLLLLVGSLLFYSFGAGSTVVVLLASIWLNQYLAPRIVAAHPSQSRRLLAIGIAINLLALAYYKYASFLWTFVGDMLGVVGFAPLPPAPSIPLPIGISFFTFQAISYLIDAYRREITPAASYREFAVYHSLFPQLVAGPIVRYREICTEMQTRRIDRAMLTEGVYRFCLGLGKKMIIADSLGAVADSIFALPAAELGFGSAWLGILCYSFQIYFDFSGYSDMAIGLGRMLGFHFPENFDQPYRSASITEFWRRWHMTLSRWFRDYVYIPLGGNRQGKWRTFANLWIVFFLCGLWHGAGLTFIVWGLYHGFLLIIERLADLHLKWRPRGVLCTAVTFALVTIGWVFFRSTSLAAAGHYLSVMFLPGQTPVVYRPVVSYLKPDFIFYFAAGVVFAFAPFERWNRLRFDRPVVMATQLGLSSACLVYSTLLLAANSFNPFIYFRF